MRWRSSLQSSPHWGEPDSQMQELVMLKDDLIEIITHVRPAYVYDAECRLGWRVLSLLVFKMVLKLMSRTC